MIKKILFLWLISINAYAFEINNGITGAWFDKNNGGQGINVEVLKDNRMLVFWYTYDANNIPLWLIGDSTYQAGIASMSLYLYDGGGFGTAHDRNRVTSEIIGTLKLTFDSCDTGKMEYNLVDGFGAGTINLNRLTNVAGLSCAALAAVPECLATNLTEENENKIQKDMTLQQVNNILGCEGRLTSSDSNIAEETYWWETENALGPEILGIFRDGKLWISGYYQ